MASEPSAPLAEMVAQWKELEGSEAKRFLDETVFPLVIAKVVPEERARHGLEGNDVRYPFMILTLGMSPQPLVLSLLIWRPRKVLLLVTAESRRFVEWVRRHTQRDLAWENVDVREVGDGDPARLYQEIMDAYERWGRPAMGAIDITGGKKGMGAAAAQASTILGFDVLYVDYARYLPDKRLPEPGTEYLTVLPNPLSVMGEIELGQAVALADSYEYGGAADILEALANRVPGASSLYYEVLGLICRAYQAWDALDLAPAGREMAEARRKLRQHGGSGGVRQLSILAAKDILLARQEEAIRILREGLPAKPVPLPLERLTDRKFLLALLGTLYHMALRREAVGRLDMAGLLWYRLLEMMEQARLAELGLDTSRPDYEGLAARIGITGEETLARFNEFSSMLNRPDTTDLPDQISLVAGYVLLSATGHPFCRDLRRLNDLVRSRNYGIYAHGYSFTGERNYQAFKSLALEIWEVFMNEAGIGKESSESLAFISLR
ncbi:MAG: TIGR02710 family CRISPR-associated CARF protein [Peptococcaceae bacterium]|jgi:CRISPR-associated protein (TIGR02710 family)|nr:TIGR02710 family CRISPR-associated CARF protein [Peptococcaceae bacterium]